MQFTSLLATATMASTALASLLQINYYTDSNCSYFEQSLDVTWVNKPNNCYNYQYGTSVNVASCQEQNCYCQFFPEKDCQGYDSGASWYLNGYSSCLYDGHKYQSFECYYNEGEE